MRFKQSLLLDVLIVAFSSFFVLRLFWFQQDLYKEETVTSGAKQELTNQVKRAPVLTKRIYDVDAFRVKPPKKEPVRVAPKGPKLVPAKPKVVKKTKQPVTRLPLELHGVILDEESSVAFVYNTAKRITGVFQLNEMVMDGVKLVEIQLNKVLLDNRGKIQELIYKGYSDALDKLLSSGTTFEATKKQAVRSTPRPKSEGKFEVTAVGDSIFVTQKEAKRQVTQLSNLLSQVRVQPNFTRSGRADGFKILHVNRGSFVEALGVNSGDIIKAINGTIVDSMQKGYELFNRLKNETAVDVEIIRNNETRTIHFEMR
jgi:type II secretion system protein C